MYYVYLLISTVNINKSYVGYTVRTPKIRLAEHNAGLSKYTKDLKPWKLVYFETFYCETCAKQREIFLKSGFGYRLRKLLIKDFNKLKVGL